MCDDTIDDLCVPLCALDTVPLGHPSSRSSKANGPLRTETIGTKHPLEIIRCATSFFFAPNSCSRLLKCLNELAWAPRANVQRGAGVEQAGCSEQS